MLLRGSDLVLLIFFSISILYGKTADSLFFDLSVLLQAVKTRADKKKIIQNLFISTGIELIN
jgi:hypothetical protein